MERELTNLYKVEEPSTRFVQISGKTSAVKYETVDVYGRVWLAESNTSWKVGSFVTIQLGRIVDKAPPFSRVKNIEV